MIYHPPKVETIDRCFAWTLLKYQQVEDLVEEQAHEQGLRVEIHNPGTRAPMFRFYAPEHGFSGSDLLNHSNACIFLTAWTAGRHYERRLKKEATT